MQIRMLVFLCFVSALVNGTGAYNLLPISMNAVNGVFILAFVWIYYQKYYCSGSESIRFDLIKLLILSLYMFYMCAFLLREIVVYSEYDFNFAVGVIRDYSYLYKGLVVFLNITIIYNLVKNDRVFVFIPILSLLVLLFGLLLESQHLIDFNENISQYDIENQSTEQKLIARPGGFLNPNMTAAISLIWLYIALESHLNTQAIIKISALALTLSVCLLTQSRAAIIFLSMYSIYIILVRQKINYLIIIILGCLSLFISAFYFDLEIANDLIEKFAARGDSKEDSAQERLNLLIYAINSFFDSPLLGNGIRYVEKNSGINASSHNQILDILANFGLVGLAMVSMVFFAFYHKNSISYLLLCIFPTLIFSHNFFEDIAFQTSLAFAYCVPIDINERFKL